MGFSTCALRADDFFVRADSNADGRIDLSDGIAPLSWLFLGGPEPPCLDAADSNDDGRVDLSDALTIFGFLFLGGPPPGPPADGCGSDPTPDGLGCDDFEPCPDEPGPDPSPPRPTGPQEPTIDDTDAPGVQTSGAVVLSSGELRLDRTDLEIPGRGAVHFSMARRYRSRLAHDGPLGHGWDFRYGERLYEQPDGSILRSNGLGHVDTWTRLPDGTFRAPPGHFRTLVARQDGSFVLRSPDGFRREFDAAGRLVRHVDRNQNEMRFLYDAAGRLDVVVDPFGREIDFVFAAAPDGVVRLSRIVDFEGREVVYEYDGSGDLVGVRSPVVVGTPNGNDFPDGRTERYEYLAETGDDELEHDLVSVTFPEEVAVGGPPGLRFVHGADRREALSFDRVIESTAGGTNSSGVDSGGTRSFEYLELGMGDPALRVTLTERSGNVSTFDFDARGRQMIHRRLTRGIRTGEPAHYETTSVYDDDHLLIRRVFPELSELRATYDATGPRAAQRNLLELRSVAGPRGGDGVGGPAEDIVWTFTYEPLHQQVATITDPRGNAPGHMPPLGAPRPGRYTARAFYDWQESSSPIVEADEFGIDLSSVPRGLDDLNADGDIGATAGNLVRVVWPRIELRPDSAEALLRGSSMQDVVLEARWNDRGQLTAIVDAEGNVTLRDYFPEDDPDGDGLATPRPRIPVTAAPRGWLRSETVDAASSPRRSAAASPASLETVLAYDPVGHITAVRSPRGVVTTRDVTALDEVVLITRGADVSEALASGELVSEDRAFSYVARFAYDANGRLIRREDENRDGTTPGVGAFVEERFAYDILGNLVETAVEIEAGVEAVTRLRYDENESLAVIIRPEGNRIEVTYDERNLPLDVSLGAGTPEESTTRRDYDRNGNLIRLHTAEDLDGDGARDVYSLVLDGFDRTVARVDPLGNRLESVHDAASNVVRHRILGHRAGRPDAEPTLLAEVGFAHDELNRIFRVDQALFIATGFDLVRPARLEDGDMDGVVSTFIDHDALSRPTFIVEDDGQSTRSIWDGASRLIERADAAGNRTLAVYDASSNPIEVRAFERATEDTVEEQEFVTFFVWDQLERLVRVSADHTYRYSYDSRDNLVLASDANGDVTPDPLGLFPGTTNTPGNTRTFVYDGRDLLVRAIVDLRRDGHGAEPLDLSNPHNPDGRIELRYAYDLESRLVGITDDVGNTTRYVHDALDRTVETVHADGTRHVFAYDRESHLVRIADPNGTVILQEYDPLHRLVRREIRPGAGVIGTTEQTFSYDGLSRVTSSTDRWADGNVHTVERVFDSLSRLIEERQDGEVCSWAWSGDGKRLAITYPGGRNVAAVYDAIDREIEISDGGGTIATAAWIGTGRRLLRRNHSNGTALSLLEPADGGSDGYDAFQRLAKLQHTRGADSFVDREYGHDRSDHRISEAHADDGAARMDGFIYDSLYRIVQAVIGGGGLPPRDAADASYLLDGAGNRRSVTVTSPAGSRTETYESNALNEYTSRGGVARRHDANGNLIDDGSRLYRYDGRNRLTEVADRASGAVTARYEYDALGRRVRKTVLAGGAAAQGATRYFYDDAWRVVEERGAEAGSGSTTYVWGSGADEPIRRDATTGGGGGPGARYLHQDARSNVVAVTDAAGAIVSRVSFDDHGRHEASDPAAAGLYLFHGQRHDPETGLVCMRNRFYDPGAGRFLTRDPLGDPATVGNQYSFPGCDPVSRRDPMGLGAREAVRESLNWLPIVGPVFQAEPEKNWKDWVGYTGDGVQRESTVAAFFTSAVQETPRSIAYGSVVLTDKITFEKFDTIHEAAEQTYVELGLSQREKAIHQGTAGVTAFAVHCVMVDKALMGAAARVTPAMETLKGALGVTRAGGEIALDGKHALESAQLLQRSGVTGFVSRLWYRAVGTPAERTLLHEFVHRTLMAPWLRPRWQKKIEELGWWIYNHKRWQTGKLLEEWLANSVSNWNFVRNVWWSVRNYYRVGRTAAGEEIFLGQLLRSSRLGKALDWTANALGAAVEYAGVWRIFKSHHDAALTEPVGWPRARADAAPPPLTARPDEFTVGPGARNTLDVGTNDAGTNGARFVLVDPPLLHPDLFTWSETGTLTIALLSTGGPITLRYQLVRGDEMSAVASVTVTPDPRLLFAIESVQDPASGRLVVPVPCLVLDGLHYPIYQFRLTNNPADVCTEAHWHGFEAFPLEAPDRGRRDPDPPRCGYGRYVEVPQATVPVLPEAWQAFLIDHIPPF